MDRSSALITKRSLSHIEEQTEHVGSLPTKQSNLPSHASRSHPQEKEHDSRKRSKRLNHAEWIMAMNLRFHHARAAPRHRGHWRGTRLSSRSARHIPMRQAGQQAAQANTSNQQKPMQAPAPVQPQSPRRGTSAPEQDHIRKPPTFPRRLSLQRQIEARQHSWRCNAGKPHQPAYPWVLSAGALGLC